MNFWPFKRKLPKPSEHLSYMPEWGMYQASTSFEDTIPSDLASLDTGTVPLDGETKTQARSWITRSLAAALALVLIASLLVITAFHMGKR